jgi:glycine cleavage system H protein
VPDVWPSPEPVYRGCQIPLDLLYDVERDVWLRPGDDGTVTLGMTDIAQTRAGRFLHIQFKRSGRHLDAGQSAATVETAKWAGPFPTPLAGTIVETNADGFAADILLANKDPYGAGWIVRMQPDAWPGTAELAAGEDALARYRERVDRLDLDCLRCAE